MQNIAGQLARIAVGPTIAFDGPAILHELSTAQYGSYHAVVPQIVLEIAFDSVQESKRHKSGYALRFPRIVRWRRDKGVEDADTLERVRAIATARADEFTQRVEPAGETAGP